MLLDSHHKIIPMMWDHDHHQDDDPYSLLAHVVISLHDDVVVEKLSDYQESLYPSRYDH